MVVSLFLLQTMLVCVQEQAQSTCTGERYLLLADYPVGAPSGSLHIFDFPYTGSMVNSPTYSANGCSPGFSTNSSEGVAVDPVYKKVYVSTTGGSEISVYTSNGLQGVINLSADYALGIAVDPTGNDLYVAAQKGLYKYDVSSGIPSTYTSFASNNSLGLTTDYPWGVSVSPINGNVYVTTGWNPTDFLNGGAANLTTRILSVNPSNLSVNSTLINQSKFPAVFVGITVASDGSLWVVNNNVIEHRDSDTGNLIGSGISTSAPAATAGAPDSPLWAIAIGPDNNVYVGSGATTACVYQINPGTSTASVYIPYDNSQASLQRAKGLAFLCSDITCPAVCSISLEPTASGCYSVTGTSKATVSVEVSWSSATVSSNVNDASDAITVTYAGQTRTIDPGSYTTAGGSGTIVSPQVVAFEVDLSATASGQIASAFFTNNSSCSAVSAGVSLPAACPPTVCATGQTGGIVFNDFNADGVKDTGEITGIPGVLVNAYDCTDKLVATATTDAFGIYSFTGLSAGSYPIRVEFSNLPAYAGMGTPNGAHGRTTVQFVNAASCNVDLGVLDNTDYCQTNPRLVIPCYVNGDPLAGGNAGSSDAVVSFDYAASGLMNGAIMAHATADQVGTLWGMAYNRFTKKVFSAATIRRHAGLGPLGLGGIYVADFSTVPVGGSSFSISPLLSVTALGVDVGSLADNSTRGLPGDKTQPSVDNQAYLAIGKAGIGGLDISEDGNTLYFTNLHDNKLYAVDMTAYNTSGTLPTAANVKSFDMSTGINCKNGNLHIWAVKVHKGKVYTGFVCDASMSQSKSDLRAYVQELSGTTVNTIFDFPLTYPKGYPWDGGGVADTRSITGWYPWTDDWTSKKTPVTGKMVHPEPILSGIEFDIDGSMVLAFADRTSLQVGWNNYNPNGNDGISYSNYAGGDVLRAYSNGVSFVLENNGKAGPAVGYAPNNNQGPGFGEFYNDNWIFGGALPHSENAVGGLALRPGSGEVIEVSMDPIDFTGGQDNLYYDSGGLRHLSNTTGAINSAYQIYQTSPTPGTFGKAAGLGDAVITCDVPTYLEIGNRLWIDLDKDGIQDPCEKALVGVSVALYNGNTLITSTTTDANGEYYFNSNPTSSTLGNVASSTLIQPNTAYTVRFGTDGTTNQYDNATGILTTSTGTFKLTQAFSTQPTANTANDSNAEVISGFAAATVVTGAAGSVNHTIDAGFICAPTTVASVSASKATCSGSAASNDAQIQITGIVYADKVFLVAGGSAIPSYTATGSQPVSNSSATFSGLANPATSVGQSYSVVLYNGPCCYTVVTTLLPQTACPNLAVNVASPVCNSATNSFSATGSVSLSNIVAGTTLTVFDNGASVSSQTLTVGQTTASFSVTGISDLSSHTVVATLTGGASASTVYVAPASCTVCSTSITTASLPNGQVGSLYSQTLTATGGTTPYNYTLIGGELPAGLGLDPSTGVISGTPTSSGTASLTVKVSDANSCSDAQPLTLFVDTVPPCSLTATVTPGQCNSTTNTYVITGTVSATNTLANGASTQSLTIAVGNVNTVATLVGDGPLSYTLAGLVSDGGVHTVTVLSSATACNATSVTYSAPASCSVAPPCGLDLVLTPGLCQSATNSYVLSGTLVAVNVPVSGTLTISSGAFSARSIALPVGNSSGTFSYSGLVSDGQVYTVTAGYSNSACSPVSETYTAPASCSVAPVCSLTATATAGICASATNTYSATAVVQLTNPTAGILTVSTGGQSLTFVTSAVSSATYVAVFNSLLSDGVDHTITVSLPGCSTTTTTYTAPASCSVTPVCNLSVTASGANCNPATNLYVLSGTIAVTNSPSSQTLTLTDGSYVRSLTVAAGTTSIAFSYTTLQSDGATHTVTVTSSGTACGTASTTYTAPTSCSVAPVCSLSAVATPGFCTSATNTFSNTVTVTMTNPTAGTLVVSDGVNSVTFAVAASTGTTTANAVFNGLVSNGASHTVVVSLPGCSTTTTTYTAPASCSVAPVCSLTATATAGVCASATNTYSATAVVQLTNPNAGVLTISTGGQSLTFATASVSSATYTAVFNGLTSDGASHTVTASLPGCSTTTTVYTAPASCSVASTALALVVSNPVCDSATNTYSATASVSLSNVVAGSILTLTDNGAAIGSQTVTAGQATASFSVTGASNAASHTVVATLTGGISASTIYSAPTSCTYTCPAPVHVCKGSNYAVEISTTAGLGVYQWYRNGVAIQGATTSSYTATQAGSYSVVANGNVIGQCPDGSCCPTLIVEDSIATYAAITQKPDCNTATNTVNPNGAIVVSNWMLSEGDTTHYFYQVSVGSSFNSVQVIAGGSSTSIPVNGILVANLPNPATVAGQSYTIRITNGSGCYRDETVLLGQTVCGCPPTSCVPFVIRRVK